MVWAWQRHNDLTFLDPKRAGVSVLVETLRLEGDKISGEPNLNPTRYPPGTWLMACARIEVDFGTKPDLSASQAATVALQLAQMAKFQRIRAIQIDFDATASQRRFYTQVLEDLRRRLPPGYPVSITALASWCAGDDWLRGLPVQEAVPMLFRMGKNQHYFRFVGSGGDFREPLCRGSAGIATDEPIAITPGKRLYLFAPGGWTKKTFEAILTEAESP